MAVIVVATEDFELVHDLIDTLEARDVAFTISEPGAQLPPEATVVISGPDDDIDTVGAIKRIEATPETVRSAVESALSVRRANKGRVVVGVDPGEYPGIAVLEGKTVVAAFQVPLSEAATLIREELAGESDAIVRIGDGARLQGAKLIDQLPECTVELVDEVGTTPTVGRGVTGSADVLAAVNIALREGETVTSRDIEPTKGELEQIKERSRDQSADNRAISTPLARQVARGDLTLREALDEHRKQS